MVNRDRKEVGCKGRDIKEEIFKAIDMLFSEYEKNGVNHERIQWELDYIIYPHIGSFLASGELSREEGKKIFEYCEKKLKKIRDRQKSYKA
ncbi:MAG: pyruvate carboxylase subunit B [Archaeoglobus sp.]|jgi:hypothetical protein|nr:MAG: pyruvate carboxylase subunit B [Archaeoglobus sp.]